MTTEDTLLDRPPAIKVGEFVFRETAFGIVKRLRFVLDAIESKRQHLGLQRSEFRVIDVGCGTGTYITVPLAQVGYRVLGLDSDHGSITRARENAATVGLPSPEFICGRVEDVESRSFHAAVCSEVLEHVAEPECILSGIRRLLRQAGLLLVTVPNGYGYFEVEEIFSRLWPKCSHYADLLERRLVRVFGSSATKNRHYVEYGGLDPERDRKRNELEQSSLAADQKHYQKFTARHIRQLIENQGFEIISFRNNTLLAGNILNALFRSSDGFMKLNGTMADVLPSLVVADWLIAGRKV